MFEVDTTGPQYPSNSFFAKEMRRWNAAKRDGGENANGFEKFPQMVYKAGRPASGGPIVCIHPTDEGFTRRNQLTVNSEEELERAKRAGWRETTEEAIEYATKLEDGVSDEAAVHQNRVKRMSPAAQREAAEADASTAEHVPELPEKPTKRGRRKVA